MKQLFKEIQDGIKEREEIAKRKNQDYKWTFAERQGKGSKAYIVKRIDLLREKLLEEKKKII